MQPFLTSGIPNLRLYNLIINMNTPCSEFNTNGGFWFQTEFVFCETWQEIGFTDAGVTDENNLEEIIIVVIGSVRTHCWWKLGIWKKGLGNFSMKRTVLKFLHCLKEKDIKERREEKYSKKWNEKIITTCLFELAAFYFFHPPLLIKLSKLINLVTQKQSWISSFFLFFLSINWNFIFFVN